MRAYFAEGQNGAKTLNLRSIPPLPRPNPGQVHIAVRAASLNYRDLIVMRGQLHAGGDGDYIPLSDAAGEVVAVGEGVWRCAPGDRVALTFNPDWISGEWEPSPGAGGRGGGAHGLPGVLCEEVMVDQQEVVKLADYLSMEEGACLPCAAVTAWTALCGPAPLLPGQTVLVQGTGGVSLLALQFARLFGARVVAITSSKEKADLLRQHGAESVIDYVAKPDWEKSVLEATGGRGVDVVVELGGADTLGRSIAATRYMGRISLVGLLTGLPRADDSTFLRAVSTHVIRVGSRADFTAMLRAMELHRPHPVIDSIYPFDEAQAALERLQSRSHVGKIVISLAT